MHHTQTTIVKFNILKCKSLCTILLKILSCYLSLPFLLRSKYSITALTIIRRGRLLRRRPHVCSLLSDTTESLVHDRGLIECGASYQVLNLDMRLSRWVTMRNKDTFGMRHPGNTCLIVKELYSQTLKTYWQIYFYWIISISGFSFQRGQHCFYLTN